MTDPTTIQPETVQPETDQARGRKRAAILLAVSTILLCILAVWIIALPGGIQTRQVTWGTGKEELKVDATPPPIGFRYDREKQLLIYRGKAMTGDVRTKLYNLKFTKDGKDLSAEEVKAYRKSILELAFDSNAPEVPLRLLLFITAIGGIIGVQVRSISFFIRHASVLNDLDLARWWAWYSLRPLLGMVFGPLVVLLIMIGMLPNSGASQLNILTMFVFSILVGMVANMFFDKLVQMAQTLFGLNANDSPEPSSPLKSLAPLKVAYQWAVEGGKQTALITWDPCNDAKLRHYEVRMTRGATYVDENYTALGIVQPGTAEFPTTEGLTKVGDKASFKVYAVLTNKQEADSNPITIEYKEPDNEEPDNEEPKNEEPKNE